MSGRGGNEGPLGESLPSRLSVELRKVLPPDTERAWAALAGHLPDHLYLGGGTAVAVHLNHRESRDLDFFFHDPSVDLVQLQKTLQRLGSFAGGIEGEGTLRGLFGATKIEAFNASALKQLRQPIEIAGLKVAALEDLLAMKLKVLAERGEMRDYFDVMKIDTQSPLSVEEGIEFYLERYHVDPTDQGSLMHLYLAMGFPDDVESDEALPIERSELSAWWKKRQVSVLRKSARFS